LKPVSPERLILLGKVIKPHGLEGTLRIRSYAESQESFSVAGTIYLKTVSGGLHPHHVSSARTHKGENICLLTLEGLTSRDQAEQYRGAEIFCDKECLPREENEYFWYELLGLEVYLETGEHIGRISEIIPSGRYDIYVVQGREKEVHIPAAHEMIREIDLRTGKLIVTPVEGLLELNAV
jgi:16S rRNA processing protein RimM